MNIGIGLFTNIELFLIEQEGVLHSVGIRPYRNVLLPYKIECILNFLVPHITIYILYLILLSVLLLDENCKP